MTLPASVFAAAHGVPPIGRQAAQRLARAELSKPVYHQHESLTLRVLHALYNWLHSVFARTSYLPGGWWGLIALAVLAVIVVSAVLARIGPVARTGRRAEELAPAGRALTARDHRESARRLAEAGDYAAAICEGVRAIAAELDERGVLPPHAGRTADEFADEAGQALPGHARALRDAALLFDDVRYGQRPGTRPGYQRVHDLDDRIRAGTGRQHRAAAAAPAGLAGGRGS